MNVLRLIVESVGIQKIPRLYLLRTSDLSIINAYKSVVGGFCIPTSLLQAFLCLSQAMDNLGIATEEMPCYNSCSLWVLMNAVYSDSSHTIADIMGKPLAEIPAEKMIRAVHALSIDKLKDADKHFNIRSYFGI